MFNVGTFCVRYTYCLANIIGFYEGVVSLCYYGIMKIILFKFCYMNIIICNERKYSFLFLIFNLIAKTKPCIILFVFFYNLTRKIE